MKILLLIGIVLFAGLLTGRVFERLGIPQVVGYIVFGILIGDSFSGILGRDLLDHLTPLTSLALALIGFMVGGELKHSVFRKYGKQFFSILFSEGLTAMFLVALLVTVYTKDLALGLLLGALSSATAPAATVDVLWEYHSKGPLTTTILAIVALDDGLSLILYGFALAFADVIASGSGLSLEMMIIKPLTEIALSLLIGITAGIILDRVLVRIKNKDDRLVICLGALVLAAGASESLDLSLILTSMTMGLYLTNVHPHRNEAVFETIKAFAPPVYILFFVFVGARLQIGLLKEMGIIGILYVLGRTAGKWTGAYFGATLSRAPEAVRKYLGFALFSQAGVAVGLALDAYQHFQSMGARGVEMGSTIINIIAATTFLVQIIGPPSVKFAISRAGEITREA
ncbi:MAG TPA: cation:proton antiporter [Nitrospirae bacterium]|nr:cation:proton antiporter [Nitrospirota bacterium]